MKKVKIDAKSLVLIALVLFLALSGGDVTPTPVPDPPAPVVDDAPFPADDLTVLIVYETGDDGIWASARFIEAMDDMDADWRVWDDDTDVREGKPWTDAMAVKRDSLPWLLISNGNSGFSGPLPETVDSVIAKVKDYDE